MQTHVWTWVPRRPAHDLVSRVVLFLSVRQLGLVHNDCNIKSQASLNFCCASRISCLFGVEPHLFLCVALLCTEHVKHSTLTENSNLSRQGLQAPVGHDDAVEHVGSVGADDAVRGFSEARVHTPPNSVVRPCHVLLQRHITEC